MTAHSTLTMKVVKNVRQRSLVMQGKAKSSLHQCITQRGHGKPYCLVLALLHYTVFNVLASSCDWLQPCLCCHGCGEHHSSVCFNTGILYALVVQSHATTNLLLRLRIFL